MACVRLDDGQCSDWFPVEQGLRQSCVPATLLFNIFFAAVIHVALTRFEADKDIIDALVSLRKKPLWGMLYADDAAVVSQSLEQLRKMMVVTMTVCEAFGLTVSKAKTEIMCL